ncbi:MAG: NAD(+)--dinitrogen-reductase ADP-D-ribosyltransferase [Gammaproteobacteria bacterium]
MPSDKHDKEICFVDDGTKLTTMKSLPDNIYLPTYQQHPVPLYLDSVTNIHKEIFSQLSELNDPVLRAEKFMDYMNVYFQLDKLKQGTSKNLSEQEHYPRAKANYLYMLRGWLFDTDSREGAILKGWVESRFGLIPTWHKEKITDGDSPQYQVYLHEKTSGIYNTNSLEAQLDLLYSYCQFELTKQHNKENNYLVLYRGINYKTAKLLRENNNILLLNNINSFSSTRERADEFGDVTIQVNVPFAKIFYYSGLLPGILRGEGENIVIGGLYQVKLCKDFI